MATLEELAADKERELQQLRERAVLASKENIKGNKSGNFLAIFNIFITTTRNWKAIFDVHISSLTCSIYAVIETELAGEKCRLVQLRADFDYNLRLLSQRDEELARYEETFGSVKHVVNSLMAENSHLKVCIQYVGSLPI